jgi:peptidoglycan/xylan/chitin deacetylase (PgdA/CDA1 family)
MTGGRPTEADAVDRSAGSADRLPGPVVVQGKRVLTTARSALWALHGRRDAPQGIRILFYHRIGSRGDQLGVRRDSFAAQMEYLAGAGFQAVGVAEAIGSLVGDGAGPGRRLIGLSFDDGYRAVVEHGHDVLRRHGFRATVFVVANAVDGRLTLPWDAEAGGAHPLLGWDEITALDRRSPFSFEAHSMSHPILPRLTTSAARTQIRDSKSVLEERLGRPVQIFAYPGGWYGKRERALVAEAGYSAACSCEPGVNTEHTDRFELRRMAISSTDSLLDFKAKVHGGHDAPPPLRRAYRRIKLGQ